MNYFQNDIRQIRESIKSQLEEKIIDKIQTNQIDPLLFSELKFSKDLKYACIKDFINENALSKLAICAPRHSGLTIQLLDYCKNKMVESENNIIFYVGRDCSENIIDYIQRKYLNLNHLLKNKKEFKGFSYFKGMCQDEKITIVIEDFDNLQGDFKKLIDKEILKDINIIVRTSNLDIDLNDFTKVHAIGVNLKKVKDLIQSGQINLVFAKCFKEELRWPHVLIHLKQLKNNIDSNAEFFKKIEEELKEKIGGNERTILPKVIDYILPELCITGRSLNRTNLMDRFRKIVEKVKATGDDFIYDFIHDDSVLGNLATQDIYEVLFYEPVIKQMRLMIGNDTPETKYEWVKESDGDYFYAKGFFNRISRKINNNSTEDVDKLETDLADKLIDAEDTTQMEKPAGLIKYFRRVMFLKYMLENYKILNDAIVKFPVIIAKLYCGIAEFYEFVGEEDKKYESAKMALDLLKKIPSDLTGKMGIQYEELQSGMAYNIIKYSKRNALNDEENKEYQDYLSSAKETLENVAESVKFKIELDKEGEIFNINYAMNKLIESKIYGNLGAYYYNKKNYDKAKHWHKKSLNIKKLLQDQAEIIPTRENIKNKIRIGIIRSKICLAGDYFWKGTTASYEKSVELHKESIEYGDRWALLVSLPSYSRIAGSLIKLAEKKGWTINNSKEILKYLSDGMSKMGIPIKNNEIDYISADWIINKAELAEIQKQCKEVINKKECRDSEIQLQAETIINLCNQILLYDE